MKIVKYWILLTISLILIFNSTKLLAQGFLRAKDGKLVSDTDSNVILQGFGLGGWMLQEGYMLKVQGIGQQQHVIRDSITSLVGEANTQMFYNAWLSNHTRKVDIDSLAAWGFNSVRLPIHYNLFTLPVESEPDPAKNTWLEKGFTLTDSLLSWCKANKMYLILDLHAAPGGQGNDLNISDRDPKKPSLWESELNQLKTIALWRKLAERYANETWIGGYDIINEPNWGFTSTNDKNGCGEKENALLKKLMIDITKAIREVDKNHIIIIEGNCWGNNYNGILPPWDNNMVLSFHKYWNYNSKKDIQNYLSIRDQYNIPLWLGETGENSNPWFCDAIQLMNNNNIGWAWWPLKKLGHNNPLQIKTPTRYQSILNYWNNKGPKPSSKDAFEGLMEFTNNLKLENCIFHRDVVDAMMRQPYTEQTIPFKNHQAKSGLSINASDYDLGRNGSAYFDKDTANYWVSNGDQNQAGNQGFMYRNDGVDIYYDSIQKTYYVGKIESDEWLQYTINATKPASYSFSITVRSNNDGSKIQLTVGNVDIPFSIPNTYGKWKTVKIGYLNLANGNNAIRVKSIIPGYDLLNLCLD